MAMTDVHSPETRSFNMSRVRSRGNKSTELRFLQILKQAGITGWRRNYPLFGQPDFVFPKKRVAVFLDGCFWHGCPLGCKSLPASNRPFWAEKIDANKRRDRKVTRALRANRWSVIRIWEHDLKSNEKAVLRRIRHMLSLVERLRR